VEAVFVPWIPHTGEFDVPQMLAAVDHFNKWGRLFSEAGIRFGYHLHGFEFGPGELDGETLLDSMMRLCDPKHVCFEMDVFWVVHGGADPLALLQRYPDRWVALHIKDIRKGAPTGFRTGGAPATDKVVVGRGAIDWQVLIAEARKLGIVHYILEEESLTPLVNIPLSLEYLRELKL
jgi:sugar phosphate isomerase/epimerase